MSFLSTTEQSSKREQAALSAFFDHRVAGIAVATVETAAGNEALERFTRRGCPSCGGPQRSGPAGIDRVTADHWKGAYDAVEHLISLGHNAHRLHRRIAARPPDACAGSTDFWKPCAAHGLERPEELIAGPEARNRPGLFQAGRWI